MFLCFDKNTVSFCGIEHVTLAWWFLRMKNFVFLMKKSYLEILWKLVWVDGDTGWEPAVHGGSLRAILVPPQCWAQRAPAKPECLGAAACRKCHHSCCCTEQYFQENRYQENQLPCLQPYHYDRFCFIIFCLSVWKTSQKMEWSFRSGRWPPVSSMIWVSTIAAHGWLEGTTCTERSAWLLLKWAVSAAECWNGPAGNGCQFSFLHIPVPLPSFSQGIFSSFF